MSSVPQLFWQLNKLLESIQSVDVTFLEKARARQLELTKPPASLGRLEEIANRVAAIQGTLSPSVARPDCPRWRRILLPLVLPELWAASGNIRSLSGRLAFATVADRSAEQGQSSCPSKPSVRRLRSCPPKVFTNQRMCIEMIGIVRIFPSQESCSS